MHYSKYYKNTIWNIIVLKVPFKLVNVSSLSNLSKLLLLYMKGYVMYNYRRINNTKLLDSYV